MRAHALREQRAHRVDRFVLERDAAERPVGRRAASVGQDPAAQAGLHRGQHAPRVRADDAVVLSGRDQRVLHASLGIFEDPSRPGELFDNELLSGLLSGSWALSRPAELAFVIGKRAKNVSEADAFDYIAGYMNCHDVSARDLQMAKGDQWLRGKCLDTFCPLGPYLVTKDEVADPHDLGIKCIVNGVALQDSSTKHLIFKIPFLMAYLTQAFTLEPGDVVTTGTPDGVGFARKPPIFLKHGDVCTVEVEGLGQLTNPCVVE